MSFGGEASQPGGISFPLRVLPRQPWPQYHEGRKPEGRQVEGKRSEVLASEATHATGGPTPSESGESHGMAPQNLPRTGLLCTSTSQRGWLSWHFP